MELLLGNKTFFSEADWFQPPLSVFFQSNLFPIHLIGLIAKINLAWLLKLFSYNRCLLVIAIVCQ